MTTSIRTRSSRSWTCRRLAALLLIVGAGVAMPSTAKAQITDPSLLPKGVDPKMPRDGFGFLLETSFGSSTNSNGTMVIRATAYPRVTHIIAGTPAEAAKVVSGDVLLSVNGQDLIAHPYRWNAKPGTVVTVRVQHGDAIREVRLISVHWYTPPDSLVAKTRSR